jgi:hypothetical protein
MNSRRVRRLPVPSVVLLGVCLYPKVWRKTKSGRIESVPGINRAPGVPRRVGVPSTTAGALQPCKRSSDLHG